MAVAKFAVPIAVSSWLRSKFWLTASSIPLASSSSTIAAISGTVAMPLACAAIGGPVHLARLAGRSGWSSAPSGNGPAASQRPWLREGRAAEPQHQVEDSDSH